MQIPCPDSRFPVALISGRWASLFARGGGIGEILAGQEFPVVTAERLPQRAGSPAGEGTFLAIAAMKPAMRFAATPARIGRV